MVELLTPNGIRLLMGLSFFPLGLLAICAGLVMLVASPYRKEAKLLAAHSARLGGLSLAGDSKSLTDGLNTLTQSVTSLIESVHKLMETSNGTAFVVILVGAGFEVAAYFLLVAAA